MYTLPKSKKYPPILAFPAILLCPSATNQDNTQTDGQPTSSTRWTALSWLWGHQTLCWAVGHTGAGLMETA